MPGFRTWVLLVAFLSPTLLFCIAMIVVFLRDRFQGQTHDMRQENAQTILRLWSQ
jgi:hypothetical protein